MYILYNFLIILAFIFIALPYFLYRLVVEKGFGHRFRQNMGLVRREEIAPVADTNCIWLHGASVGEMVAISPLVKEIKNLMPERKILVSAVTVGGYDMARQIMPEADAIINFPLDLPFVASSMVSRIRPGIFIMVETELWPNFLRAIRERNIPAMMMNGRISEKSAKSYRYLSSLLRDMLNTINLFCMQSSIDAKYITQLGADPAKIIVTGNTKFDQTYAEVSPEDLTTYKTELGLLTSFTALRKKYPHARLIIAPRKLNRIEEIKKVNAKFGYEMGFRSKLKEMEGRRPEFPVLLLDTIGELGRIYAIGDIVFVGGSLVRYGGHNVLEPAAHAKPILVGPSMEDFKDSYSLLSKAGACRMVADTDGLTEAFLEIAGDDNLRKRMGEASIQIIRENRGAALKTIHYLTDLLDKEAKEAVTL